MTFCNERRNFFSMGKQLRIIVINFMQKNGKHNHNNCCHTRN